MEDHLQYSFAVYPCQSKPYNLSLAVSYGVPCQISFCILYISFQALSSVSCCFLSTFHQLIIGPLTSSIFFDTFFVPLATISHFADDCTVHHQFRVSLCFIISTVLPVVSKSSVSFISKHNSNCVAILSWHEVNVIIQCLCIHLVQQPSSSSLCDFFDLSVIIYIVNWGINPPPPILFCQSLP